MAQHARRPAAPPKTTRRKQARPAPPPRTHPPNAKPRKRPAKKRRSRRYWLLALIGMVGLLIMFGGALIGGGLLLFASGRVPPNTQSLGVDIGWLPQDEAAEALARALTQITVQDGPRTWQIDAGQLGVMLDAQATAARAANGGLAAYLAGQTVPPVLSVNTDTLRGGLEALAPQVELAPRNAGIRLFNGDVQPVPAEMGRQLDVEATVAALGANPAAVLARGTLPLVMIEVVPRVPDAAPLVAQAEALLASPLTVRVYDPFSGDFLTWRAQPPEWAAWLIVQEAPDSELGVRLALDPAGVQGFVEQQASATLARHQQVRSSEVIDALNAAISRLAATATVRLREDDRTHTVRSGETITSIAWDYGIPYPYIQQANGGVESLSAGQTLTIPSREVFFEHPVAMDKRIVVSISGNRTKVYENGQLKWDWASSTGINSSPTWPGVYQIITHEENAYAGNWNLYMPWFMGVYKPIPGSDFTNGFHGFPTRGGGQLLWENSLGTRVTYGCILLSNTNARLLYDWAEDGVVVEIKP